MTSQKGLRYDGSIDKYPITEGEIYSLGNGSKITIADITLGLPEFSKNADCVFIDPAGSKGVLKAYYTKAEKQCPVDNFDEFVAHIKRCIEQINPDRLFVECFYRNKKQLVPMVESLFPHVKIYENTYYHKPDCKCWIIQGTKQAEDWGSREWMNGMRCSRFVRMFRSALSQTSSWGKDLLPKQPMPQVRFSMVAI